MLVWLIPPHKIDGVDLLQDYGPIQEGKYNSSKYLSPGPGRCTVVETSP